MEVECYFSNKIENSSEDSKEENTSIPVKYNSPNPLIGSKKDPINKNSENTTHLSSIGKYEKTCDTKISFNKMTGMEKILFYKMISDKENITQQGPAISYEQTLEFYNSIKNVDSIFDKYNLTLNRQKLFEIDK